MTKEEFWEKYGCTFYGCEDTDCPCKNEEEMKADLTDLITEGVREHEKKECPKCGNTDSRDFIKATLCTKCNWVCP